MNELPIFQNALAEALEKRREWLDRSQMVRLKEAFRIYQSSFSGLYRVLIKKGVLREDPYKNDEKIGELQIPPESPFSEGEKIDQMSIRLSGFEGQLDFLVNFYQFSVDFLTMERIKRIAALVRYFAWTQFSQNSQYINTRALVEITNLVKGGNDSLSTGLIADSIAQLDKSSKDIFKYLKEITDYHRESYKLELRLRFLDSMTFDPSTVISRKDETLLRIKREYADAMADRPFYAELVEEVLKEDYSGEGPNLKDELLKRLEVQIDKPTAQKAAVSYKALVMDGLRFLCSLSFTLDDTLRKLDENSAILESEKNSLWEKVKRIVQQLLNRDAEALIFEVNYFDSVLGTSKTESLDYTKFRQDVERKARLLSAFGNRTTGASKKLETAEDDHVLTVLSKNIEEMQSIHKTMSALDAFFKSETSREDRDRIRGIKPELTTIKNGIVKANQKRHEYIAQKEELEQMKRLGIKEEI